MNPLQIAVYLDIDGVLSIPGPEPDPGWKKWGPYYASPIPMWSALLHLLNVDKRLDCHWLTNWEGDAWYWNRIAHTALWPALARPGAWARRAITDSWERAEDGTIRDIHDWKLTALRYRLHRYHQQYHKVIWIEDGFAPETIAYAKEQNWALVDTTDPAIQAALLAVPGTFEQAKTFIDAYITIWGW